MTRRTVLRSAFAFAAMLLLSATADAQLFRSYLSVAGNDANPCTLPAPCRLLPAALTAVANGGEIWMLDSANYNTGPVAITKSVSILAVPGVVGSVLANGGNAINIATAGVNVALRNLVIVPFPGGGGTNGINMTNGAGLTVENCLIANLPGIGILVSTAASVQIVDSVIRNNGSDGVQLLAGPTASMSGTKVLANGGGIYIYGSVASTTTTLAISDSIVSGNYYGVDAYAPIPGAVLKVSVTRSTVSNNVYGVISDSNSSLLTLSNSMVTKNSSNGLQQNGTGVLESLGNNTVRQNGINVVGAITAVAGT